MSGKIWCAMFCVSMLVLSACGGGGGGDGGGAIGAAPNPPAYAAGSYPASSTLTAHCARPRTGIDPSTGRAYADVAGSVAWENSWLRSWTHELYLWYRDVPDLNPFNYSSATSYFDLLKTSAVTPSGSGKDRFHFYYPTDQWLALSQSGVSAGYGVEWVVIAAAPPRVVRAAYVEPGSPAAARGITRGAQVISVDGVNIVNGNISQWPEGLFPDAPNESHTFVLQETNGQRTVIMSSANVTSTPVQNVQVLNTGNGMVGYMLFNDHIATAEQQLIAAFNQLQGVSDLVLDIRYNGGGYLAIASEVAYMIAGGNRTSGRTFERLAFNDQYPNTNPVTGASLTPAPFYSTALGFSATSGQALPTLNLSRVYVLTGNGTCSASESIINGLRGVGVEVIQIGSTTCGKPYGFYPADNCGTTYFSIQFKGVNALGFGDYTDGFTPNNANNSIQPRLPGCSVADDFTHALGDVNEGRLAAALSYRISNMCSGSATGSSGRAIIQSADGEEDGYMLKNPLRENRILQR